jgi:hypothetical protein
MPPQAQVLTNTRYTLAWDTPHMQPPQEEPPPCKGQSCKSHMLLMATFRSALPRWVLPDAAEQFRLERHQDTPHSAQPPTPSRQGPEDTLSTLDWESIHMQQPQQESPPCKGSPGSPACHHDDDVKDCPSKVVAVRCC